MPPPAATIPGAKKTETMNKNRYLIGILAAILLFSCKPYVKNPDDTSMYENAEAVFLKMEKEYVYNEDGAYSYTERKRVKLLTYRSFNKLYGETFIVYNPKQQKLKINSAFTQTAENKELKTPENAFNEVLPSFAANAPAYNHLREMVVTHTGIKKEAIINLDYTLETQKGYMPAMMADIALQETSPIKELKITVKMPKGKKLAYHLANIEAIPTITETEKESV